MVVGGSNPSGRAFHAKSFPWVDSTSVRDDQWRHVICPREFGDNVWPESTSLPPLELR